MKTIKINYVDFWPGLDKENFPFTKILRKKYNVEISENPDYLFCSCFGAREHYKYMDAVKILFLGENMVPDFNLYDYAMGFDYLEFGDRYIRLPLYVLYTKTVEPALNKHTLTDEEYLSKKGFCCYVVSNPNGASERDRIVDVLNTYKTVDSGGRYRNNVGGPVKDKKAFVSQYKFSLAFENSSTPGYTTEKIFEAFAAGTIPIYWGSNRIAEEFNPEAFINCHDYADFSEVLEKVKEIDENDELFLKMLKAPIISENSMAAKYLDENYILEFLENIIEQEPAKAKRRNMVCWGENYQKRMKSMAMTEKKKEVIKKPLHLIKKTIKQIISK